MMTLDEAIKDIEAVDLTPYRAAHRAMFDNRHAREMDRISAATKKNVARLKRYVKRRMGPHEVDWSSSDGFTIDHKDWLVKPYLRGTVYPRLPGHGKYLVWGRLRISFETGVKSQAEMNRVVAGMRAAADAMADAMFAPEDGRI